MKQHLINVVKKKGLNKWNFYYHIILKNKDKTNNKDIIKDFRKWKEENEEIKENENNDYKENENENYENEYFDEKDNNICLLKEIIKNNNNTKFKNEIVNENVSKIKEDKLNINQEEKHLIKIISNNISFQIDNIKE